MVCSLLGWSVLSCHDAAVRGEAASASLCNNGCVLVSFQIQSPGHSDLVSLCVISPVYAGGLLTTLVVCIKLPRRSRPGEAASVSLCNNGCVLVSFQIQYPGYSDLVSVCDPSSPLCLVCSLLGWSFVSCHDAAVRGKQPQHLCVIIMVVFLSILRFSTQDIQTWSLCV